MFFAPDISALEINTLICFQGAEEDVVVGL